VTEVEIYYYILFDYIVCAWAIWRL